MIKTYFEFFDLHVPSNICIDGILKYVRDCKSYGKIGLILGGDQLDLFCISHWTRKQRRSLEGLRLKDDYDKMNLILDKFDKVFKGDKYWLDGNHEDWVEQFLEEHPALEGLIEPEENLNLKKRGYKIIPLNHYLKIGKNYYLHGYVTGKYHSFKNVSEIGRSCRYGHVHNYQVFTSKSPIDSKDIHRATSLPCMCNMKPKYGKNKNNNWTNGFGITFYNDKGYFQGNVIDIFNGKFIGLNGKEYKL